MDRLTKRLVRTSIYLFLCALLSSSLLIAIVSPADASGDDFLGKINGLRASKGLSPLVSNGTLAGPAQSWASKMAAAGYISHNPNLSSIGGGWSRIGENVGTGTNATSIFNALVGSSRHYANMTNPAFNSIGIGVSMGSDGKMYTAHVFAAFSGVSAPSPVKKAPNPGSGTYSPESKTSPVKNRKTTNLPIGQKSDRTTGTQEQPSGDKANATQASDTDQENGSPEIKSEMAPHSQLLASFTEFESISLCG